MTESAGRKLRVVQVGKYYWPVRGGIETYTYHLCNRIKDKVDLTVLVSNDCRRFSEEDIEGVHVLRVPRWAELASTPISPGLGKRLKQLDPDIVHVHLPNPMAEVACLLAKPRGKIVVMYHSDIIKQKMLFKLYRPIDWKFLKRADAIIATAPQNVEFSPVLSRLKEKTRVIAMGVEPNDFALTPERERKVAELRARFGGRIIFFVGRHVYYKGLEFLVRAMAEVDGHAVIGSDGPLTASLQSLARELGVEKKITFVGRVSDEDLPSYYHASDVFCLPSIARSEAFGLVQIEAMACGKPVVSTRLTTGVVYANLDGVTGLTVEPKDAHALAGVLGKMLGDPALRERLGTQALARVRREFTHDLNARKVLELYEELTRRTT